MIECFPKPNVKTVIFKAILRFYFKEICRYSGILSAYGMALADVVHEAQRPLACEYNKG